VKPWENVRIAVYFLQEENKLPGNTDYLQQLVDPVYRTVSKKNLMNDLYETTNRIIRVTTIQEKSIKEFYTKYFGHKKVCYYSSINILASIQY
jgi:hypothetical protein